jgi:hypothetical protein
VTPAEVVGVVVFFLVVTAVNAAMGCRADRAGRPDRT